MAQRKNTGFGELRETAPTDDDFYRAVGEKMGRSQSTKGKRIAALGVWVVVIAFMTLTVMTGFQVNNNRVQNGELRTMMETQYNPSFKTRYNELGSEIISAWYNTNASPAPVQLAEGVTWPHSVSSDLTDIEADNLTTEYKPSISVRNVTFIGGRQNEAPDIDGMFYEIDMYSAYVDGTLSTITVTFAIPSLDNYTTLPTLMNEPSILPSTTPLGSSIASNKPNWRDITSSPTLKAQLESWAKAYTTNDNGTLKQITGDNSGSFYLGAVSSKPWEYIKDSATIVWLKENNGNTNEAVAQITWKMKLPDYTVVDPKDPEATLTRTGATQTQRLEILIQAPASGLPLIVAWGPVGSYLTLNPGTNKLTEEEFKKLNNAVTTGNTTPPVTEQPVEPEPEPSLGGGTGEEEELPSDDVTPTPTPTPTNG